MTALSGFFLNTRPSVIYLEVLELIHPKFSQTYRLVKNADRNLSLTHEGPAGPFTYSLAPLTIRPLGSDTDLDQEIEVVLGDVGEIMATEIQAVSDANAMMTKPTAKYRVYRSDDFSAPLFGPVNLRIDAVTLTTESAAFKAKSASYNIVRTGEVYRTDRFPMLESV